MINTCQLQICKAPLLTTMFGSASPVGTVVETQTGDSSKQVPGVSTSLFSAWRRAWYGGLKATEGSDKWRNRMKQIGRERNIEKSQAKQKCLIAAKPLKKRKQNGQLKQKQWFGGALVAGGRFAAQPSCSMHHRGSASLPGKKERKELSEGRIGTSEPL